LTDHKALLQAVFTNLSEEQRYAFLVEVSQSLTPERQKALAKVLNPTLFQKSDDDRFRERVFSPNIRTESLPREIQSHQPKAPQSRSRPPVEQLTELEIQRLLAKAKDTKTPLDNASQRITTPKSDTASKALERFESLHQADLESNKKPGKKEVLSCMGLGLLAFVVLFLLAMGLKFVWTLVVPQG